MSGWCLAISPIQWVFPIALLPDPGRSARARRGATVARSQAGSVQRSSGRRPGEGLVRVRPLQTPSSSEGPMILRVSNHHLGALQFVSLPVLALVTTSAISTNPCLVSTVQ